MGRSWRAFACAALAGVSLAGCTSPHGGGSAARGELHGQVLRPAGRDPRSGGMHPGGSPGTLCRGPGVTPVAGDPVEARDLRGRAVASTATGPDGSFSFSLLPGSYRVVESILGIGANAEVRAGGSTSVTLTVPSDCSTPVR
ncbi:carboxypeptidase-like regulatory domain-containing protein [Kitasatospora sp. NPDC002227]|uniref:carboxypeptidase-like regulatory domain-containing protein n=1 Tax=Kitasatospora sp. NPDC002227 TaxID=3154773 RepID=UPI0033234174